MFNLLQWGRTRRGSMSLATATLGFFLLLGSATSAQAHDRDACYRRINKAEWKLDEAVEHHGYYSRQAEHRRHELREARERCWRERHEWWDRHENRWRRDREWGRD